MQAHASVMSQLAQNNMSQSYLRRLQKMSKKLPWSAFADEHFFGAKSQEQYIVKYSQEYYEFQEFYGSFLQHRQQSNGLQDELAAIRECLKHYEQYKTAQMAPERRRIDVNRRQLPIYAYKNQILQAINENQVAIIAASTGAGKSTQVPQYLMESGFKKIACTQPRRIAAITLSQRVSFESRTAFGSPVGYQIRFDSSRTRQTRILFLTEGLLLRQLVGDPLLSQYDCIIVDEVHERHMVGDFLLGILKSLCVKRPELKLILMSATINAELFQKYFDDAPLIEVPGRLYSVTIDYVPGKEDADLVDSAALTLRKAANNLQSLKCTNGAIDPKLYVEILKRIDAQYPLTESGDLLIFVSGMQEITSIYNQVEAYSQDLGGHWIPLKLHSSLPIEEQDRVFEQCPKGFRKCIVSTNIAETSVTIDGVRFVVDSGRARELDADMQVNISRLSEFYISKASANQRSGRAGRTQSGHCYRMYSEREYECFNDFGVPEIQRARIDQIVLSMKALELGDARTFDYVERPPGAHIEHSICHLTNVGAFDADERLTLVGYALSVLPVDVVIGKMLILSAVFELIEPVLIIASAMSVQSPFMNLNDLKSEVTDKRKQLDVDHGDSFTIMNAYIQWVGVKAARQQSTKQWCAQYGIQEQRMYEISKLIAQYRGIMQTHLGVAVDEVAGKKRDGDFAALQRKKHESQHLAGTSVQKILDISAKNHEQPLEPDTAFDYDASIENDLNSLEFEVRNDSVSYVEKLMRYSKKQITKYDVLLLKLIMSSGLHPNVAVADDGNETRRLQDQVYHTQKKRFLHIHPSSVFAYNAEFIKSRKVSSRGVESATAAQQCVVDAAAEGDLDLATQPDTASSFRQLNESSAQPVTQFNATTPEFMAYLQVLETNKPYLVNAFRVPSLTTSLLFAKQIDTDGDMSMLVVDDWVFIKFRNKDRYRGKGGDARVSLGVGKVLDMVYELRILWSTLVESNLIAHAEPDVIERCLATSSSTEEHQEYPPELLQLLPPDLATIYAHHLRRNSPPQRHRPVHADDQSKFYRLMERFMAVDQLLDEVGLYYAVDTLRPEDLEIMFPPLPAEQDTVTQRNGRTKQGIAVCDYISYASIHYPRSIFQPYSAAEFSLEQPRPIGASGSVRRVWECHICKQASMLTQAEIAEHQHLLCKGPPPAVAAVSRPPPLPGVKKRAPATPKNQKLMCPVCFRTFDKQIDMARHKRTHQQQ